MSISSSQLEGSYSRTKERKQKEIEEKNRVYKKLTESGDRDRIKKDLEHKLAESGWYGEMQRIIQSEVQRKGIDNITVESLVEYAQLKGQEKISDRIKAEVLAEIKESIEKSMDGK